MYIFEYKARANVSRFTQGFSKTLKLGKQVQAIV